MSLGILLLEINFPYFLKNASTSKTVTIMGVRELEGDRIEILDIEDTEHVIPLEIWVRTFPNPIDLKNDLKNCYLLSQWRSGQGGEIVIFNQLLISFVSSISFLC